MDYVEYVSSIVGSSRAANLLPALEIHEAGAIAGTPGSSM